MSKLTYKGGTSSRGATVYEVRDGAQLLGTVTHVYRSTARNSDPWWRGLTPDGRSTDAKPTRKAAAEALRELAPKPPAPLPPAEPTPPKLRDLWSDTSTIPPVPKVSTVEMAFPATAMDYLPPWDILPEEFRENGHNAWMTLANTWFHSTRSLADRKLQLALKEDIDMDDLRNLIHVCMRSYAPKHEHKIGGVAYMLSRWCEDFALDGKFQVSGELVNAP